MPCATQPMSNILTIAAPTRRVKVLGFVLTKHPTATDSSHHALGSFDFLEVTYRTLILFWIRSTSRMEIQTTICAFLEILEPKITGFQTAPYITATVRIPLQPPVLHQFAVKADLFLSKKKICTIVMNRKATRPAPPITRSHLRLFSMAL